MTLLLLRKAPARTLGMLSNWMLEVDKGVFLGRMDARLRALLWEDVAAELGPGYALMAWHENRSPEGFAWVKAGEWPVEPVDWGGVTVMFRRAREKNGKGLDKAVGKE